MKRIIALMAMAAIGLGFFLYPEAFRWNSYRNEYREYYAAEQVTKLQTPKANNALLASAQKYNAGLLHSEIASFLTKNAAADLEYQAQMRNPDTSGPALPITGVPLPRDAIGRVSIPKVDIALPVYHGATENVLAVGAGHVYGTSLPVGGESTHTVITAHSRPAQSGRFTRIRELEIGDEFFIVSLGQTMRYVVDEINTVLPTDDQYLKIVPGKDYATLLTCTPLGVNSHRLLVRGVRADLPPNAGMAPELNPLPFPMWAVWFFGGIAATGALGAITRKALIPG